MGMQIRCRCGANLVVAPGTESIVCAACQTTMAVPQPERDFALSETVPAFQVPAEAAPKAPAPAKPARSLWPFLVLAVVGVCALVTVVILLTRQPPAKPVATTPVLEAMPPAPSTSSITATSPEELVVLERAALAHADRAALETLLAPTAFGHGIDAAHVALTGPNAAATFASMFGGASEITSTWSKITRDKDIAWISDELELVRDGKTRKLLGTQLAFRDGNTWRVAAWHLAELVGNKRAAKLARDNALPMPAAIADQFDDDHQVHDAFAAAFASREAFVDALSDRADAIDLGSAAGERVVGGAAIKRTFTTQIKATFKIHDGIAAGRVSDRAGWGAANVDFTAVVDGTELTQTFRVLAILVRERAGWRIVLAQWSNAGPLPD